MTVPHATLQSQWFCSWTIKMLKLWSGQQSPNPNPIEKPWKIISEDVMARKLANIEDILQIIEGKIK